MGRHLKVSMAFASPAHSTRNLYERSSLGQDVLSGWESLKSGCAHALDLSGE
jgi:hypothetical protein